MSGSNVVEQPTGFTRREVIDLMHKLDLPCRVEAVEKIMYLAQQRVPQTINLPVVDLSEMNMSFEKVVEMHREGKLGSTEGICHED